MAEPVFAVRTLYAPAHFGNSYEVMGENEMRQTLAEAKWWGFNHYGDWFDTVDCADPFADPYYNLGAALWDRKKSNFRTAQDLGLACELIITPNHVFLDQCHPDLVATKTARIFGQLLCPSKPAAREIILHNYENLLRDLAHAGIRLSAICSAPYDYGGCACEQCAPWIITFAELSREIYTIARRYHPDVEAHFIGWWWSAEEHRLFAEWADRKACGWVKSIFLHIPYGETDVSDVPLPAGAERRAFVHIGYADQANPRDVYGHLGPVIAPTRLEQTVSALRKHHCTGVMAYSEGVFDDVNKSLLAGLGSGQFSTSEAVLEAYVERYWGTDRLSERVHWLKQWGRPFEVNALAARHEYEAIFTTASPAWRLDQWRLKSELLATHARIGSGEEWTTDRLAAVEEFWALQETLYRQVWGLGPVRHIFGRRFTPLPWYASWAQYYAAQATDLGQEQ
ncbi:MAG: hypothetical protein ACUVX8_12515 [Candidatus Zipacnadales bacterium]